MSIDISTFQTVRPPTTPCSLGEAYTAIQTAVTSVQRLMKGQFAPGLLDSAISSLKSQIQERVGNAIGKLIKDHLPANLPNDLILDAISLIEASGTPETFERKAIALGLKYGKPEVDAMLAKMGLLGSDFDFCKMIPNLNVLQTGLVVQLGLPAKIAAASPVLSGITVTIPPIDRLTSPPGRNRALSVFAKLL